MDIDKLGEVVFSPILPGVSFIEGGLGSGSELFEVHFADLVKLSLTIG